MKRISVVLLFIGLFLTIGILSSIPVGRQPQINKRWNMAMAVDTNCSNGGPCTTLADPLTLTGTITNSNATPLAFTTTGSTVITTATTGANNGFLIEDVGAPTLSLFAVRNGTLNTTQQFAVGQFGGLTMGTAGGGTNANLTSSCTGCSGVIWNINSTNAAATALTINGNTTTTGKTLIVNQNTGTGDILNLQNATNPEFAVNSKGGMRNGVACVGTTPQTCTSGASGRITAAASGNCAANAAGSCMTFAVAFAAVPVCVVQDESTLANLTARTVSASQVGANATAGDIIDFICIGNGP